MRVSGFVSALMGLMALALSACAMAPLPPPQATLDNIQAVRAANLPLMAIGSFTPAPGHPTQMDRAVVIRAGSQAAPGGSYARYLGDTIAAELSGAGRLDPTSGLVVSGVITDTYLDSNMSTARAALSARITLTRAGRVVYDKTLSAQSSWEGNFMGAVAIPDAFNHYTGLFQDLAGKLLADPEFQKAARGE
ncbi:MAG: hypothetical protein JWP35_3160 [Caulobacter sp.]|nr:hypothetical protein [Caulobacter sp.]